MAPSPPRLLGRPFRLPANVREIAGVVTRDGQRDENVPSRALYITAAFSGLGRRGELLARGWRAVDFDQEAFRVVESCGQGELWRPKSGRGRERHTQPAGLVFPGSEGGCMDSSAPRRGYVAALKLAALRVLGFHDLRHSLARWRSTTPRSSRSGRGWATPTSIRRCATRTTRAAPTTRGCSPHAFRANGGAADESPGSAA